VVHEDSPPQYRDEREFIDEFRTWSNLERVFITAEGRGPFDDVDEAIRRAETPLLTSRHFLYTAFAEAARERNIRVLLDGVGGEYGPSSNGGGLLVEWLRHGQWRALWRELGAMSRVQHKAAWRIFGKQALLPLMPDIIQRARSRNDAPSLGETIFSRADFARAYLKDGVKHASGLEDMMKPRPDHRLNQSNAISMARGGLVVSGFKGDEWVWLPLPLFDQRVVEYCLAAPGHLKLRNGFGRNLLRVSLDGILPRAIQWRTSKVPFSPDYPVRYNRQRLEIYAWLGSIPRHDPVRTIVDVENLQQMAAQDYDARRTASNNLAALHTVPFGVYLIHFLRQFDSFS
jgi:asparagine synthase (glutamine-hydrolysing)